MNLTVNDCTNNTYWIISELIHPLVGGSDAPFCCSDPKTLFIYKTRTVRKNKLDGKFSVNLLLSF